MTKERRITVNGNEAAALVAFRLSEAIAIFPITPSSRMAELCDECASRRETGFAMLCSGSVQEAHDFAAN